MHWNVTQLNQLREIRLWKRQKMALVNFESPLIWILNIVHLVSLMTFVYNYKVDAPKLQVEEASAEIWREKLLKALQDKLDMSQKCQKSEERYVEILLQIKDLHQSLRDKSLRIHSLTQENVELLEEISLLKYLIEN